ncbi:MAG: NAD(P)/FAD-dependent oxidoreductase [Congregibacter sp.]
MSEAHTQSWYAATANWQREFAPIVGEHSTDVCVIGGGYSGLSSAIHLRKRGIEVTVLEARRLCWGASGRNGGHVGTGQRADQDSLERLLGKQHAQQLWQLGLDAVDTVCDLIHEFDIDCELKTGNLHVATSRKAARELREEVDHMQAAYDYAAVRYVGPEELASLSSAQGMHGAYLDAGCRHLHPLNYGLGLARAADQLGANLHEGSRVLRYEEGKRIQVYTENSMIECDSLILACNGYLGKLEPRVAGQIMPINNYMLATEPLHEDIARRLIRDDTSMSDSRFVVNYWKLSADNRLLFGGGESYRSRFPKDIISFVRPYMRRIYPELADTKIDYGWGGTLAITLNRMPALGRLGARIFHAHGYSGHGVPIATLAGQLLAEAIDGDSARFDAMANVPTPRFPGGTLLRWPGLVAGMLYYSMRDRLA